MNHLKTGLWMMSRQLSPLTRVFLAVYLGGLVTSIWVGSALLLLINVIGTTALMVSAVRMTYRREAPFLTPGMRSAEVGAAIVTCSVLTWLPLLVHIVLNDHGVELVASGLLLAGVLLVLTAFSELIVAVLMLSALPLLWMKSAYPALTERLFSAVFLPDDQLALIYSAFGIVAYAVFAWRLRVGEAFRPMTSGGGIEKEVLLFDRFSTSRTVTNPRSRLLAVLRCSPPPAVMEWLIFCYTMMFALLFALDFGWDRQETLGTELALCFVFYLVTLFAWARELPVDQLWLAAGFSSRRGAALAIAADQLYRDTRLLLPALTIVTAVCLTAEEPYLDLPLRLAGSILFGATIKLVGDFRLWLLGLFFVLVLAGAVPPAWFAGTCLLAWSLALARFVSFSTRGMPLLSPR